MHAVMPESGAAALRVDADACGGRLIYDGSLGQAGGAPWSSDRFLVIPVYQDAPHHVHLHMLFWDEEYPSDEKPHARIMMAAISGIEALIVFPLAALDLNRSFLRRSPGRLKNVN